jgi:hypothetical protein
MHLVVEHDLKEDLPAQRDDYHNYKVQEKHIVLYFLSMIEPQRVKVNGVCVYIEKIRPITIVKVKGVYVYVNEIDCTHGDEG